MRVAAERIGHKNPAIRKWADFGILFLVSGLPIFGGYPIGLAYLGVFLHGRRKRLLGILLYLTGIFLAGGSVLAYGLSAVLYFLFCRFVSDREWRAAVCGLSVFAGRGIAAALGGIPIVSTEVICEGIGTMGMYLIFFALFSGANVSTERRERRIRENLWHELHHAADGFAAMGDRLSGLREKESRQTAEELLDRVAGRICPSCARWTVCWQNEYGETTERLYRLLETVETEGYCDAENLSHTFCDRCIRAETFLAEFCHTYELFKERAMREKQSGFGARYAAEQYREIAARLEHLANRIRGKNVFWEEEEAIAAALGGDISAEDVEVKESGHRIPEVRLHPPIFFDAEKAERVLSEYFCVPMHQTEEESVQCFSAERYLPMASVCQKQRQREDACGDFVCRFPLPQYKHCVLLCDGMGCGAEAKEESALAAELISSFLNIGFSAVTAVGLANSTLILHSDREVFSTVDLFVFDTQTGSAAFYKAGAAKSYHLHRGRVVVVEARSLPIGILEEITCREEVRSATAGDVFVLVSDGVYGEKEEGEDWIAKWLLLHGREEKLAEKLLEEAEKRGGTEDDMTVATVKIRAVGR